MSKKSDFFTIKNVMTTLKGMVVGFVVGIPMWIISIIMTSQAQIGLILTLIYLGIFMFAWGYIANKFWKWD